MLPECSIFQNVMPFLVATSMSLVKRTRYDIPDGISYARAALATTGIQQNTFGYYSHAIQVSNYGMYVS